MGVMELLLLSMGLAMDAFAVSVCKGLALGRPGLRQTVTVGLWFGAFQALMPLLGFLLGSTFEQYIVSVDHWIAFALLSFIGVNMLRESGGKEKLDASLHWKTMLLLAIATSIDALAIGVTFSFLRVAVVPAAAAIGGAAFLFSAAGVRAGGVFGARWRGRAELCGGVLLILLGLKILLEHLGVLP